MGKLVYPQLRADQQFCAVPASAATAHLKVQIRRVRVRARFMTSAALRR